MTSFKTKFNPTKQKLIIQFFLIAIILIILYAVINEAYSYDFKKTMDVKSATLQDYIDQGIKGNSEYVVNFYKDDNSISYMIITECLIDEEKTDLSNLSVYYDELGSFYYRINMGDDDIINDKIRIELLKKGIAQITDDNKASEDELNAEKYAKDNMCGIWNKDGQSEDTSTEDSDLNTLDETFIDWNHVNEIVYGIRSFAERIYAIPLIRWLLAPLMSFGFLCSIVIHLKKSRRVLIFFGGDVSAGKTTLQKAIMEEHVSEAELLAQKHTKDTRKNRYVRDEEGKRIELNALTIDIPGNQRQEVIDNLDRWSVKLFRKVILIIVLSPIKGNIGSHNSIDNDYILRQYNMTDYFWTAIIKSKKIRVSTVIIFVNKNDIIKPDSYLKTLFQDHITLIKEACKECKNTKCITIIGSSVKRNGLSGIVFEAIGKSNAKKG